METGAILIIGFLFLLLVVGAVVGIYYFTKKKDSENGGSGTDPTEGIAGKAITDIKPRQPFVVQSLDDPTYFLYFSPDCDGMVARKNPLTIMGPTGSSGNGNGSNGMTGMTGPTGPPSMLPSCNNWTWNFRNNDTGNDNQGSMNSLVNNDICLTINSIGNCSGVCGLQIADEFVYPDMSVKYFCRPGDEGGCLATWVYDTDTNLICTDGTKSCLNIQDGSGEFKTVSSTQAPSNPGCRFQWKIYEPKFSTQVCSS